MRTWCSLTAQQTFFFFLLAFRSFFSFKWCKKVYGTAPSLKKAKELLRRVATHCAWGASESKVAQLLEPKPLDSVHGQLGAVFKIFDFCESRKVNEMQNFVLHLVTFFLGKFGKRFLKTGARV